MKRPTMRRQFEHRGVALLRAAIVTAEDIPSAWPDPTDTTKCRSWLLEVWTRPSLVEAIRLATPALASRVDTICAGDAVADKQVRRATMSVMRYLLRAIGRHTPFGLFAGVAPASIGPEASVRWGSDHRPVVRADTQWLLDLVERLEACSELLGRLDVTTNNLAFRRGTRLEIPCGQGRASIRCNEAVRTAMDAAASPVRFADLTDKLTEMFPAVSHETVRNLLVGLVQQGFLITSLRAPSTVIDPIAHVVDHLDVIDTSEISPVVPLQRELQGTLRDLRQHNDVATSDGERAHARSVLTGRMRALSDAGRTPLAVNLRLDCDIQIPTSVVHELECAASALLRLSRQPTGEAVWRDYYTAFCERYGVETLVPLADVVHPEAGLGLPATYPGSVLPEPTSGSSNRDAKLLALAWRALAEGSEDVVLADELIQTLEVGDPSIDYSTPPHVEMAAHIQSASVAALQRGDYTLIVHPARAAGTLTSRFAHLVPDAGLDNLYADVPVGTDGALPVQLSFLPLYPHAENISRVAQYLPQAISLGEHHDWDECTIPLDDLAVTADRRGLHLVSRSRRRVLEPQVFHALALDKQPPPLARFLAHLSHGLNTSWHQFDWGPHARDLPYLPRVRYRRSVLAPARWRLVTTDLLVDAALDVWIKALDAWRQQWRCPAIVELVDADRSLPLDLTEPAHAAIAQAHLARNGEMTFIESPSPADLGWIGGRAHDVVVPLFTTRAAVPSALSISHPVVTNRTHGQHPGASHGRWLFAKVYTHPERMDELLAQHLPNLLDGLGDPDQWFARYRSAHETDHLRLRLRTTDSARYQESVAAIGSWAQRLRDEGLAGRLVLDTYYPEIGRYGDGPTMAAAEHVFVADSRLVAAQLRQFPPSTIEPRVLTAIHMLATVEGFLGGPDAAAHWFAAQLAPTATVERELVAQAVELVRGDGVRQLPGWNPTIEAAWEERTRALAAYHERLVDAELDLDAVLESLLHMHHNRALGIDHDGEAICRRLTRQAALTRRAIQNGDSQ